MANPRWQFNNCLSEQGTVGAFTNTIYSGCCCNIACRITNVWGNKMTLTGINLIHSTGSFTSSLISVNNNPPSFPYNVNSNAFVDIEIEICAGSGNVADVLDIQIVSAEHGAESHLFNFDYPALPPTITPSSIDFGLVQFGTTTTPVSLCFINNSTLCSNIFLIDATDCVGISPTNSRVSPDAGGLDTDCLNFTWTPIEPCEILDCDIKTSFKTANST